jgi:membrane-bound lytic murein transglycosylase F
VNRLLIHTTLGFKFNLILVAASVLLITLVSFIGPQTPSLSDSNPLPADSISSRDNISQPENTLLVKKESLKILLYSPTGISLISNKEQDLLAQFAQSQELDQEIVLVSDVLDLTSKLESGDADIVASLNNNLLQAIEDKIIYTLPWSISKLQVIGRADSNTQNKLTDLYVRQLALKKSSPAWQRLSELAASIQSMEVLEIPERINEDTILKRVKSGQYDLTVLDSLSLPPDLEFNYNLKVVMDLSSESIMTWGVRPDAISLHKSLNKFLSKKHLESVSSRSYRQDFQSIKQRKLIRLITYKSPVNYYYDRGRFKGFEYELIKRFADNHGMRLNVVIADSHKAMLKLLEEGKGDLIAASAPEDKYIDKSSVKLSSPYNYASAVIIGRKDEVILDARDLQGRTVYLPPESPYKELLQRIKNQGIEFTILETDSRLDTESVLFKVAQGVYDLSIVSSHEVKAELSRQLNLKAHFNMSEPKPLVWVVRKSNTLLLSALNDYISSEYRKGYYNVIYDRYVNKPNIQITNSGLIAEVDQLSPYDEIVHKYADHYGFDWRLIVAQMYQESRFNPRAISDAGAEGLMQILPSTAEMIGVDDPYDPENSIGGGVLYMDYLMGLFEDDLTVEDTTWFTLASYNAGYSRVKRARELAVTLNLDKNKWFNNVETAMLKLAAPYKKNGVKVQDCRCGQTASYVREIRTIYNNYLRLTQSVKAASSTEFEHEES